MGPASRVLRVSLPWMSLGFLGFAARRRLRDQESNPRIQARGRAGALHVFSVSTSRWDQASENRR